MGILDSILGTDKPRRPPQHTMPMEGRSEDAIAVERYRYMLKTAPPETLEQAHAEAFSRLTPEQRRMALASLASATPENERQAAQQVSADDPQAMGRLATRAEMRQPGFMERTFGAGGGFGGSLLGSFAMGFVGSMVAQTFLSSMGGLGDAHAATEGGADGGDGSGSGSGPEADGDDGAVEGDFDAGDFDGGDFGGDF